MENNNKELNGVKKMIADGIVTQEAAEKYFPELKESEDERIMKELIKFFRMGAKYNSSTNGIPDKDIVAWLEKQNKQKPAWSEDDEGICRAIINDIANDKSMCTFDISKGICDEQINWLKSLKERVACEANCTTAKQWKPSEEQIAELEFFISDLPKCSVVAQKIIKKGKDTLVSLLSDLKKLREE
jgi:hypothetical protein